ncbi:SAG family member [Eimeria mitis]|uniref:SAG family member n=1 Tax=Eimeria mitis TaxID=44415 RepID=U6JUP1_9EIME|nr:SAG family member [Eimeria mitis]CDJ27782.1 SAG family member [Eimeria mitis]
MSDGTASDDLGTFLTATTCANLKSGEYNHIVDNSGKKFVISATKSESFRRSEDITCAEALEEWKKGFELFEEFPSVYQEQQEPYNNPNAVGLVSLLSDTAQVIRCGLTTGCTDKVFVCYFKPAGFDVEQLPVSRKMWHKLEASHKKKPTLKGHEDEHEDCLTAVNDVRTVAGLDLPKFVAPHKGKSLRKKRSIVKGTNYEEALYNLTCEEIEQSKIDPTVAEDYTLIYAVGDESGTAPTAAQAVEVWKTGFSKLGTDLPPAFKKRVLARSEVDKEEITGEIYYDNVVAGFASLMADGEREMLCYNATGCKKSALICFITEATLVEEEEPISETTWNKILALAEDSGDNGATDGEIKFTKLGEKENCLTEINEFRTQDNLGLNAFVAEKSATEEEPKEVAEAELDELLKGLTCSTLKSGKATILSTDTKRSLIYHSGTSATCSDAVDAWKKGYEKFSDVDIPPKYTADEELYKTGAATNFISLVSEGEETVATCYSVTGCSEKGLACVLDPAVFEKDKSPITEETWTKVAAVLSSGVGAASAYGALLSSAFVVVGLFALNF